MTRAWTRWQDWAEVVIGVLVVLSPLVVTTSNAAMWTMIVLGALIAIDGLASLAMPGMVYGEWFQVVLGALLFISPWVMGYSDLMAASWVSWVGGVLTVAAGATALSAANAAHSGLAGSH
ncbi:SPW repeat protein [Actinosynnema sp. NPDC047251]|nr:SPW repeat protein [Saccharothrix espanaensis]